MLITIGSLSYLVAYDSDNGNRSIFSGYGINVVSMFPYLSANVSFPSAPYNYTYQVTASCYILPTHDPWIFPPRRVNALLHFVAQYNVQYAVFGSLSFLAIWHVL